MSFFPSKTQISGPGTCTSVSPKRVWCDQRSRVCGQRTYAAWTKRSALLTLWVVARSTDLQRDARFHCGSGEKFIDENHRRVVTSALYRSSCLGLIREGLAIVIPSEARDLGSCLLRRHGWRRQTPRVPRFARDDNRRSVLRRFLVHPLLAISN